MRGEELADGSICMNNEWGSLLGLVAARIGTFAIRMGMRQLDV
jgi:hypothetical protein